MNSASRNLRKVSHYFHEANPYTTVESIAKLIDGNLFETSHKDIFVLNKPPGFNFLYIDKDEKGLINVLKQNVCKKLNWKNCFRVPTITNMNQSGACILVSNKDTRDLIIKNFRAFNTENKPFFKFYGISTYVPLKHEGKEIFAISPKESQDSTEFEYYENKNPTINDRKKRKAIVHHIEHKVIKSDPKSNVSLVEFKTTKNNSDGILIYCAKNLMPLLGDNKYSYLVKKVFGKPVYVPNQVKKNNNEPPILNPIVLKSLDINEYLTETIPLHLQLCELNFEKKFKKQKIVLNKSVPLLPFMEETLFRFGFNLPELDK